MSKIIFIAPYPFQRAPSQRFRFEQYIDTLRKEGHEVEIHSFLDEKGWNTLYKEGSFIKKGFSMLRSFGKRILLMPRIKKANHVFIHREASMIGPPIFEWFIAKVLRKKYIYDFDDAIWLPNYSESNAKFQRLKNYSKVKKIIKWADTVVVGNEYLSDYAKQFNQSVTIIPTTIDTLNLHTTNTKQQKDKVVIGWTGTHTTMNYLDSIIPVIQQLEKEYPIEFRIISNQCPEYKLNSLVYVPWKKETEIEDLSKINIGLMPMEDTIWTKGKCGFKGLQYMALQIPAIMSPVGMNNDIIEPEINGFFAAKKDQWYGVLKRLIVDIELRERIGVQGQKTVIDKYSVEANTPAYLKLFR
jgi:glycosyltransferase involved in cell wall biosynthesis